MTPMAGDLHRIFKAYDIRGVYPSELDDDSALRVGRAFAEWSGAPKVLVGQDCRLSSPALSGAFVEGLLDTGTDVVDLGLATTDMVYFASGRLSLPGVMFTASHNPPQYNGIKLCRAGAAPVGQDTGLQEILQLALSDGSARSSAAARGTVSPLDFVDPYLDH